MGHLFEELKRREIVRVGIAYMVVGRIVSQVVARCEVLVPETAGPNHDW